MTIEVAKLRELAKAATPGPWDHADAVAPKVFLYSNPAPTVHEPWERVMIGETYADGAGQGRRNLAFIAAANPQVIIALLEQLARMTIDRDSYANSGFEAQLSAVRRDLADMTAEVARIRTVFDAALAWQRAERGNYETSYEYSQESARAHRVLDTAIDTATSLKEK